MQPKNCYVLSPQSHRRQVRIALSTVAAVDDKGVVRDGREAVEVEYGEALAEIRAMDGCLREVEESRRQEGAGGWGWDGEQVREARERVWSSAPVNAPPNERHQFRVRHQAGRSGLQAPSWVEEVGLHGQALLKQEGMRIVGLTDTTMKGCFSHCFVFPEC